MRRNKFRMWQMAVVVLVLIHLTLQAKKSKTPVVSNIDDIKEYKKLLRTKTNVLVLFVNAPQSAKTVTDVFKETAETMKGQATLVYLDCNNMETKKLCKKLKVDFQKPYSIKHYKDGEFHKDYDRSETVASMSNFLRDPTGDLPWEEDPQATDIFHLQDAEAISKFLRRSAAAYKKSMIMFYAPWCGYCKVMKPEYVQAAADLKGEAFLAAIDVAKPGNSKVRHQYNITGFPTLLFYDKGQLRFTYNGENKRQAIVDFMKDPVTQVQQKKEEVQEDSWSQDSDVVHLTGESFDAILKKTEHALVVFYAPWCGHCKRIKPEFEKAASAIKITAPNWILGAVDATKNADLAARFGVKGYPTLKYFKRGEYQFDAGHARKEQQIIDFVVEPSEPPPPPPPEKSWSEEESQVRHLDGTNFKSTLRKIKHALIMFYAPWCGHCKNTKPDFVKAAERFSDELMVLFGAVDCTTSQQLCESFGVRGYPTIKYFSYFDKAVKDYNGGRKDLDFVSYIVNELDHRVKKKLNNLEAGFGPEVLLADDDTFPSIIDQSSPTFIMFYATWCDQCNNLKPIFSQLAAILKTENSPIKAVAIDVEMNGSSADRAQVTSLPTFVLMYNGKHVATYDGDQTLEDMLSYIKSYKVKDEL